MGTPWDFLFSASSHGGCSLQILKELGGSWVGSW